MRLSSHAADDPAESDYLAWLLDETARIDRSLARSNALLHAPAPRDESWCQELAAVVMQWRISMLDVQLRHAVPVRFCEFHRWYMGIVALLTACGDALNCYIHPQDELDAEVVRQLALKRLAQANRAWQELHLRLSALETHERLAATEPAQPPPSA